MPSRDQIPSIPERVNYVVRMWQNPCDAPWAVYLETLWPAALRLFIMLLLFDVFDVVRYVFKPRGLRRGGHLRKRVLGVGRRGRPSALRQFVDRIPYISALRGRKVSQGVKNLWIVDGIGQRFLWWWLVADVITGFLYQWTSAIYATSYCQAAKSTRALREGTVGAVAAIQGWQAIQLETPRYETGAVTTQLSSFKLGAGRYQIALAARSKNVGTQSHTYFIRMIDAAGPEKGLWQSAGSSAGPGEEAECVIGELIAGPRTIIIEQLVTTGFAQGTYGALFILGLD